MTKSERLLALLQLLREYRQPAKAETLAEKLGVSQRTIYRDIDSLRLQGADIVGEAGIGYVLRDGFLLPPLMFSIEEVEALILGSRWVTSHADSALREAAHQAMTKIQAVIPEAHRTRIGQNTLFTPLMSERCDSEKMSAHAAQVRQAIRNENPLVIDYEDGEKKLSQRTIYPFSLAFFDSIQVIGAWCKLREDFRHFRVDRIATMTRLNARYLPTRKQLFRQWQARNGYPLNGSEPDNTTDKN